MKRRRIHEHALQVLEYEQVLGILANFASCDLGRDRVRQLYPSTDPHWIRCRIAETSELKALLDQGLRIPLVGLRNIVPILKHIDTRQTLYEPEELIDISDTLGASARLKQFFSELDPSCNTHLRAFAPKLSDFETLVQQINTCIDGRVGVRDNASDKLQGIRRHIQTLEERIRQQFQRIVSHPKIRKAVENNSFLMRHGRPVVALKAHYRMYLRGTVLDRSNTGATLYVEPDELVELSNELEDARFEEKKEVDHILWELTHAVLGREKDIMQSIKTLSLIDLTYAKARFSQAYQMSAPEIGASIHLQQARHPLLMQWASTQYKRPVRELTNEIVPISPRLGDDFDLLLITGPNTGGKTVLLKTIGLCVVMAQSGLHIPAQAGSQLAVYQTIFADIGDEQSIQQSLSTFSAHMRHTVRIIEQSNTETLVLLDELGAGTDPTEGAALATAILQRLLKKAAHVIATTHLGQLKNLAFSRARAENASVQFDTHSLKPTYKLFLGTPGSSNALAIARRLGMSHTVIDQAQGLLAQQADGSTELINQVQQTRELAEQKRRQAQALLDQAGQAQAQAAQELSHARQEGKRLQAMADLEIDQSMRQIQQVMQGFQQHMQNAPGPWRRAAEDLAEQIHALASSTPLAQRHAQFMEGLRKGDTVYILPFRRQGIVDRIRRTKQRVSVLLEGKQLDLTFDQVCRPYEKPANPES